MEPSKKPEKVIVLEREKTLRQEKKDRKFWIKYYADGVLHDATMVVGRIANSDEDSAINWLDCLLSDISFLRESLTKKQILHQGAKICIK